MSASPHSWALRAARPAAPSCFRSRPRCRASRRCRATVGTRSTSPASGAAPSPPSSTPVWRAAVRAVGYLVALATGGLGFLWVGFDREKRGLHDWLAGTYVIKSPPGRARG